MLYSTELRSHWFPFICKGNNSFKQNKGFAGKNHIIQVSALVGYICLPPTQGAASLALGYGIAGLSARIGSRVVNPKLEYLYYGAPIVSHCLDCRINATSMTIFSFYGAPIVSHGLYCRIKLGKSNVVFFGQKVCHGFRLK
jgi:hypothetical protein